MGLQGEKVPPALSGEQSQMPGLRLPLLRPSLLVGSPQEMAVCARVCMCCVCASTLDCTNTQLCFSNANLTRGLCVAATARPTSTTVSCIEMPASLDPKSRSTTMDTAKVRSALTAHWGARKAEQCGRDTRSPFHPDHSTQSRGDHPGS